MGACLSPADDPVNPSAIDLSHFTLLKVVGKGGFGKVNAVKRKKDGALMAMKRISKAEVLKKESHLRIIWIERAIMVHLSKPRISPFIVNLEHCFQDASECYMVMSFMQGGDLRFHMNKMGHFSEEAAKFYACEILLGLEAMHSNNILYRDLKPDNLLLDSEGHVHLSDFGLSVQLDKENKFKARGNSGTVGYLAPEMFSKNEYSFSVDVWAFGITLYEMLHGRRPFSQWTPGDPDPFLTIRWSSGVSASCRSLIRELLRLDVDQRIGCSHRRNNSKTRSLPHAYNPRDETTGRPSIIAPLAKKTADSQAAHASYGTPLDNLVHRLKSFSTGSTSGYTGWSIIKQHPWFDGVEWNKVLSKTLTAPILPDVNAANCNNSADLADQLVDFVPTPIANDLQFNFKGYEFNTEISSILESPSAKYKAFDLQPGEGLTDSTFSASANSSSDQQDIETSIQPPGSIPPRDYSADPQLPNSAH